VAYTAYRVGTPLSRIIDKLPFVWRAVRNERNIALLLYLIVYRCIADIELSVFHPEVLVKPYRD